MQVLGVILARAGSKGLPDKCVRPLLGRPVIAYTLDHARSSRRLCGIVLTTDSEPAKALAHAAGVEVVDRPAELASDTATVDAAARHAVETWEARHARRVDAVVLLYGNIPVRAEGLIDRAIDHLVSTGADSVRSVAPVTKQHPDWVHRLEGDRMTQYRENSIYRRQDLEPLYYHDGAVVAVTRAALFGALATPEDKQSFLGRDRRAIVQSCDDAVDIDGPVDFCLAEALLRARAGLATPVEPASAAQVLIAGRLVGPGQPPFVIAEAGVNHNGSVDEAMRLIDAAKSAGAEAVKFQVFRVADLVAESAEAAAYQRAASGVTRQSDMLRSLELSEAQLARLADYCRDRGILFLATPFSRSAVDLVKKLGSPAIKIASTDLTNLPLLDHAAGTGLPLIVSTGAATAAEIDTQVTVLLEKGLAGRLVLMHCVSAYPTPVDAANLGAIAALARRCAVPVGFSDHTTRVDTGAWAVAAGACVLEKHFTLDRSAAGPDHAVSLEPDELAAYIRGARQAAAALGSGAYGMSEIESEVRRVARRSVVAARDIPAGTPLTPDLLTLKRPGTGIRPEDVARLLGRAAATDIPADTVLAWDMVQ